MFETSRKLQEKTRAATRRRFLASLVAGAGGIALYLWWRRRPQALRQVTTSYVTANRDFYTVSIEPRYPALNPDSWRLSFLVESEERSSLTLEALKALPRFSVYRSLECISNPVGGAAIGNALWTVTPLPPLIAELAAEPGQATFVAFRGADGFYSSVPYEIAMDPGVYLAYEMNGVPLPREHGFPVRVLLPGRYGMKQPRWLTEIELTKDDPSGYWEKRGWSHEAMIRPMARIDSCRKLASGDFVVTGVAFCGASAVGAVEVSVDDGANWREALLREPPVHSAWSTWELPWKPDRPGSRVLAVRVRDGSGKLQEDGFSFSFPNGSQGIHRVFFEVET